MDLIAFLLCFSMPAIIVLSSYISKSFFKEVKHSLNYVFYGISLGLWVIFILSPYKNINTGGAQVPSYMLVILAPIVSLAFCGTVVALTFFLKPSIFLKFLKENKKTYFIAFAIFLILILLPKIF